MLAEFIDRIAGLARRANSIETLKSETLRKVFVRKIDLVEEYAFPPVKREGTLIGLEDVVAAAFDVDLATSPELYYDGRGLVLLLDRHDRRGKMTMPLEVTRRFALLAGMTKDSRKMAARDLIQLLRFDLHGADVDPVIAALRKLNFTRRSDGSSSVEHGRESLGRSVEAAVQQAEDIPEEFTVTLPVYANPGIRELSTASVRVGVHVDVHDETLQVRPLADEVEGAVLAAQQAIGDALRARLEGVPVFHGRP